MENLLLIVQHTLKKAGWCLISASIVIVLSGVVISWIEKPEKKIRRQVIRGLFDSSYGNPLHLRDGERLPRVICTKTGDGIYKLTIEAVSVTVEQLQEISSSISSSLCSRSLNQYAVTQTESDRAFNGVSFRVEDVSIDRTLTFRSVNEMKPESATRLRVQDGTSINLTTSGSILCAGKTRSGKTTGIISLLLQVALQGPDSFGSEVIIIDPKQAELSRLPHVVSLDDDGKATAILAAMRQMADTVKHRQAILNNLSIQTGDAVKWWEAGMNVSTIFIDEYVALRSIFPSKADKEHPDYCLATFDSYLKRIITMGASAGCYAIISIAEASVGEGGLPAMLRSAMSTRILFRPTRSEALLIWDKEKIENCIQRTYGPGDAWFSSTDGVHDEVSFVHFPRMEFPVYKELGRLLQEYYDDPRRTRDED